MKVRAVIAGLAVLTVVLCAFAPCQAAKSNRHNINFMPPADEHPWQESGAPFDNDEVLPASAPTLVFVVGPGHVLIIRSPMRIREAADLSVDEQNSIGGGFVPR